MGRGADFNGYAHYPEIRNPAFLAERIKEVRERKKEDKNKKKIEKD